MIFSLNWKGSDYTNVKKKIYQNLFTGWVAWVHGLSVPGATRPYNDCDYFLLYLT